jgi:Ca-activated chloride channel family protein
LKEVDDLKYQKNKKAKTNAGSEVMNIKLRYKQPDGEISKLIEHPVADQKLAIENTSDNFRFAAAVAQFGMLLRHSEFKQEASYKNVLSLAGKAKGKDEEGYRNEFIKLVKKASVLQNDDDVAYTDGE